MAQYVLLSGTRVVNAVIANSPDEIGPFALLFEAVDVTNLNPQPSVGWTLESGMWYPPMLTDEAKALWNGTSFDSSGSDEEIIDAEIIEKAKEIEAPTTDPEKGKKRGK
jgi:hypothetical protein